MNIYEKIQKVRVDLANSGVKMSGHNDYANYDYFELNDFLPMLNRLMLDVKMTAIPSFKDGLAILTAINIEDPTEKFEIESPLGSANLKGCHEVQNIGAIETYQRRYLYQAMFDIAESDALNKNQGKPDKGTGKAPAQRKKGLTMSELKDLGVEDVGGMAKYLGSQFGKAITEFDEDEREEAIAWIKENQAKRKAKAEEQAKKAREEFENSDNPLPWD